MLCWQELSLHSYKPQLVVVLANVGKPLGLLEGLAQVPPAAGGALVGSHGVGVGCAGFAGQLLGALVVQGFLAGSAAHVKLDMAAAQAVKKQTEAIHQNKARTVAGLVVLRFGMRCSWMGAVMADPLLPWRWLRGLS